MSVKITTLDQVDRDKLAEVVATYVQMLREQDSTIDLNPASVLRQLVVELQALFGALEQTQVERLVNSWSLQVVTADPTLADDALVDSLVSNYLIVRGAGAKASGRVVIILDTLVTTPLALNTTFTAGGVSYQVIHPFTGVVSAESIVSDEERLIRAQADGTYAFTVDVQALEAGATGVAVKNTEFVTSPVIPNMVRAYAEADFTGGENPETNAELMERLAAGISAQSMADVLSIEGQIRRELPTTKQVSIVGFGDPEMNRDRYNLLGVSTGGKVDIIVRTASLPTLVRVEKTAVLDNAEAQRWRLQFLRDELSGFYFVEAIKPPADTSEGTLPIVSDVRGLDLTASPGLFIPNIQEVTHGVYTPFQTATVKFTDADTLITESMVEGETTRLVDVYVMVMPGLWDLQYNLFSALRRKDPAGDYLVRAPIPCFVAVNLLVKYNPRYAAPDQEAIQRAVSEAVNKLDFTVPDLPATVIIEAAHNVLGDSAYVELPVEMRARLFLPDGQVFTLGDTRKLSIPEYLSYGVSRRTTAFYLPTASVDVALMPALNG